MLEVDAIVLQRMLSCCVYAEARRAADRRQSSSGGRQTYSTAGVDDSSAESCIERSVHLCE